MKARRWRTLLLVALAILVCSDSLFARGKRFRRPKCRALDTREEAGPTGGQKLANGSEYVFSFNSPRCPDYQGLSVDSYEATVTLTGPNGPGFLHFRAANDPIPNPLTSDMNYDVGWTIANETSIPVDPTGSARFLAGVSDVHVIVDLYGFTTEQFPPNERVNYTGAIADVLIRAGNDSTNPASAGLRGFGVGGMGTQGFSTNNFGVYGRSDSATSVYGDARGGGTYGVYGVADESSNRSGVLGDLVDGGGTPLARGFVALDQGVNNYAFYAQGNYGGTGAKYFVEPHPTRADLVIRYVALEGPEAGTYFRGRGKFQNGLATIDVPEDFRLVTDPDSLTVQVTPIGEMASVAVVRMDLDRIVVRGSRNVPFSYLVNGVRKSHRDLTPIGPGIEFAPEHAEATIPAYLTPVQRQLLISNGTYNADGTVNLETARALGWDRGFKKEPAPIVAKEPAETPPE